MIIVIDFGSQYTQLIIRKVREAGVYCESFPHTATPETLRRDLGEAEYRSIKGIILSGGPASVFEKNAPLIDKSILSAGIPVLGICYGMQLMAHLLDGEVKASRRREYGRAELKVTALSPLFKGIPPGLKVWMSHGDSVCSLPSGFKRIAESGNAYFSAISDKNKNLYGVQFHPEVNDTDFGKKLIENFLFRICRLSPSYSWKNFIDEETERIKKIAGSGNLICGLSGGVDSSVAASIVGRAVGKRLFCIFVDNGLLRLNEREAIQKLFGVRKGFRLITVDASSRFLRALKGVTDPEKKRKIIGREFIRVFEKEAARIKNVSFLCQGTLYPDFIESVSVKGPSEKIKTHHNVGGLPKRMKLSLIEPLKYFFKDEVRKLGKDLGLPEKLLYRHPFPGPGLAIRIIGEVTKDRLKILRLADAITEEEIIKAGQYRKLWQAFCVLLPVKTVGIMGDKRSYENVIALRVVKSTDAMTADWARLPYPLLARISGRIINEVRGINRVVYDISSKPPATIEWE